MPVFLIVLLLAINSAWSSRDWNHFAAPMPVHDAIAVQDSIWLASDGGIRVLGSSFEGRILTTVDGLEETSQLGLVIDNEGVIWSISKSSFLSRYHAASGMFQTVHKGFAEKGERIRGGQMLVAKSQLILGFEKGLAIFDTKKQVSTITLRAIQDKDLISHPIQSMLVRGDTLLVALDSSIYFRIFQWDSLSKDLDIADPLTWVLKGKYGYPIRNLWMNDTVVVDGLLGQVYIANSKLNRMVPGKLGFGIINGDTVNMDEWYQDSVFTPYWIVQGDHYTWFGDSTRLAKWQAGTMQECAPWSGISRAFVSTLQALPDGGIAAWSYPWLYWWNGSQLQQVFYNTGIPDDSYDAAILYPMKSLAQDNAGNLYLGLWGGGVIELAGAATGSGGTLTHWYHPNAGSCVDAYIPPSYSISLGVAGTPWGGAVATYWGHDQQENGGVAYMDGTGSVQCFSSILSSKYPNAIVAATIQDMAYLFVSYSGSHLGLASGGVDVLTLNPPQAGQNLTLASSPTQLSTGNMGAPVELYWDATQERLWALFVSGIGYWSPTADADSIIPIEYMQGYDGASFSGIDIDRQGNLWLSTRENGVYRVELLRNKPDSLVFHPILARNGLLSNVVYDVAVNTKTGEVWFAHDLGLSAYRWTPVRETETFQTSDSVGIRVYPNPFRPGRHSYMIFDRISESSKLLLRDASGQLVRSFQGKDLQGGRVYWDGLNGNGIRVASGVYSWTSSLGKKTRHGKFLVIW